MLNNQTTLKRDKIVKGSEAQSFSYAFSSFVGNNSNQEDPNHSNRVLYSLFDVEDYLNVDTSIVNDLQQATLETEAPSYLVDGTSGVDKVRLQFEIDPDSITLSDFMNNLLGKEKMNQLAGPVMTIPEFPHVYVKWDRIKHLLSLEFNPSHFLKHAGFEICPFRSFKSICKKVIIAVITRGDPEAITEFNFDKETGEFNSNFSDDWGKHVLIRALDLARDFYITDMQFNSEQLTLRIPKYAKGSTQIRNQGGKLNTLTHPHGKNISSGKLYNKYEERKNAKVKDDELEKYKNIFRYEVRVASKDLLKYGLNTLEDFSEERAHNFLKYRWNFSKYGEPLIWEGETIQTIHALTNDSVVANELIGYLESTRLQIKQDYSPEKLRSIKSQIKKMKIKESKDIRLQGKPYGYLDFESGNLKVI